MFDLKVEEFIMRSRFRSIGIVTGIVLMALSVFVLSSNSSIDAQGLATSTATFTSSTNLSGVVPTATVFPVGATNNRGAFLTRVSNILGLSSNSIVDIHASTASDISVDTQAALGVSCSSVVVYRVTEVGDLVIHPFTCAGSVATFKGTGGDFGVDYIVAAFGSLSGAQAAPQFVLRSGQSLPVLGGGSTSSSSSTSATTSATTAATAMPTVAATATMVGTTTP